MGLAWRAWRPVAAVAAMATAALAAGCSTASGSQTAGGGLGGKIAVVAAENFWAASPGNSAAPT